MNPWTLLLSELVILPKRMINFLRRVIQNIGGYMFPNVQDLMSLYVYEGEVVPKETKRDAAVLAVHHSKAPPQKMTKVDFVRVDQIYKYVNTQHGQVLVEGDVTKLTIFMNKEKPRLERLMKNSLK